MTSDNETIRWPTNLDRAAIGRRLVQVREAARSAGLAELAALFAGVETMAPAQIATSVVSALAWLEEKPAHEAITKQLQMVALNLKNLKQA